MLFQVHYGSGDGGQPGYDTFELGTVTTVGTSGRVQTWRPAWAEPGTGVAIPDGCKGVLVAPAGELDVPGVLQAVRERAWPSGGQAMPFRSLDEARTVLQRFRAPGPRARLAVALAASS